MARKLRIQYPGAIYHVMNRGDHGEAIYQDDQDRILFLKSLGEVCAKTDWIVHAYCLMSNHFHLVVETPCGDLVAGMHWWLSTYTSRYNRRHQVFGHLFSGRYKALIVEGSGTGYLRTVCDYVHLNPARAHLLRPDQRLSDYEWSSYPSYLKPSSARPAWLAVQRVMGELGWSQDTEKARQAMACHLEARRWEGEDQATAEQIRHSWYLGGETFHQSLLARVDPVQGPHHVGVELRENRLMKAERLVQAALAAYGWKEEDLGRSLHLTEEKIQIARQLRAESTMSLAWIAQRLKVKSAHTLRNRLQVEHEKVRPDPLTLM